MATVLRTNYEDFADIMVGFARDGYDVTCVTYEQNSYNLLRELLNHKEITPCGVEIQYEEFSGYDKEYYISLTREFELFVEPAYHEKNEYREADYFDTWADMIFTDMDVYDNVYKHLHTTDDEIHNVEFRAISEPVIYRMPEEEETYCDCRSCNECTDDKPDFADMAESLRDILCDIKDILEDYLEDYFD